MEEGGGGPATAAAAAAAKVKTVAFSGQRQRFATELKPGETTIVSWKKLVKDSNVNKVNTPPAPVTVPSTDAALVPLPHHPALDSRIAPGQTAENAPDDPPPASRFSAVIEKIERLYMGKHSSDEEDLNDVPDDDEYDTEDSFIDDVELDEYFQVDNSAIKHDGFFINRGKLERISNEPTVPPVQPPKKRRRKDSVKDHGGSDDGHLPNKQMKVSKKATNKPAPEVGKNSTSLTHSMVTSTANLEDVILQNQINAPEISGRKHSSDAKTSMDQSSQRVSYGEAIAIGKDNNKQKTGLDQPKNHGGKLKDGIEFLSSSSQRSNEKGSHAQYKSQSGRSLNSGEELNQPAQRKEKSGIRERSDIKVLENSLQTTKTSVMHRKEGSNVKSKGSMLEKAIRELEKVVAESRPPSGEVADADNSAQAVKRRMPPEIKQKLAKVAYATHGKISKELLSRLMTILGHLMQLRTLKRNLKLMVNMGLSAKQEKDARFHHIKKEVDEMVKIRIPLIKSKAIENQAGPSDDFQETSTKEKEVLKRRFSMDGALEDKICDLYDLYVDALEEDAGPHLKKLYAELVELWPKGYMDNSGIKRAICRSKDRKKAMYSSRHKDKDQEDKIKRKKLPKTPESIPAEASSAIGQPHILQEKLSTDLARKGLTSVNRQVPSTTATTTSDPVSRMPITHHMNGPKIDRAKQENVKGSFSSNPNDPRPEMAVKKKRRKAETELGETHIRHEKLTLGHGGEERHKSNKQATIVVQKPISKPAAPLIPNLNHAAAAEID